MQGPFVGSKWLAIAGRKACARAPHSRCQIDLARRQSEALNLDFMGSPGYLGKVNRLIAYLRDHLIIDFQGDLTVEKVRELLAGDDSRDSKALLAKVVAERSADDMMLVLADCLLEPVQNALTDDFMRDQLRSYTES